MFLDSPTPELAGVDLMRAWHLAYPRHAMKSRSLTASQLKGLGPKVSPTLCFGDAITALDGVTSWREVRSMFKTFSSFRSFVSWLVKHQIIEDHQTPPLTFWPVRVYGHGPLAARLAMDLLRHSYADISIVEHGPVRASQAWDGANQSVQRLTSDERISIAPHWLIGANVPRFAIVALETSVSEPAILFDLHRHKVPTLVLSSGPREGHVGPLLDERTTCWRCWMRSRFGEDSSLDTLVDGTRTHSQSHPVLAQWMSSCALMQVFSYAALGSCEVTNAWLSWSTDRPWRRSTPIAAAQGCHATTSGPASPPLVHA